MLKWLKWTAVALVGLLLLGVGGVFAATEVMVRRKDPSPVRPYAGIATDASVERGAHLGRIYGCDGCHEDNLQGGLFFAAPNVATVHSSNLTRRVGSYTDAELARAVRDGVRADGSALFGMPSESWVTVTDAEMADLIAWLRSHPEAGEDQPRLKLGFMGRIGLLVGEFKPASAWVAEARAKPSHDAGPAFAKGRHLADTVCSECHGSDLTGGDGTPDLMIAAAYDGPTFSRLMRTGVGAAGGEHGLMTEVARGRFAYMTDQEVSDLHAYLVARSERPTP